MHEYELEVTEVVFLDENIGKSTKYIQSTKALNTFSDINGQNTYYVSISNYLCNLERSSLYTKSAAKQQIQ